MGTEFSAPFSGSPIATSQQYRDRFRPTQPDAVDAQYGASDLQVSNFGNTQVQIQIGRAIIQGKMYELQSSVHNLAVAANGGGSNRVDIVVLRYEEAHLTPIRLHIVQGSPGAGTPALTNSLTGIWDFPLAQYEKQPGGNIVNVIDRRKFYDGQGGLIGADTSTFPQGPRTGLRFRGMPSGQTWIYDGSTWQQENTGWDWLSYTPTMTAESGTFTISNGTLDGRYKILDRKTVHAVWRFTRGSTTSATAGANWRVRLPTACDDDLGSTFYFANIWMLDTSAATRALAHGYVDSGVSPAEINTMVADYGTTPAVTFGVTDTDIPWTWATGDRLNGAITYPMP